MLVSMLICTTLLLLALVALVVTKSLNRFSASAVYINDYYQPLRSRDWTD